MKIAVCLKRVPDTTTKIVIGADGKSIDEAGVKFVPNPYDEYALEEALSLKEKAGSGETVVICLGTDAAQKEAAPAAPAADSGGGLDFDLNLGGDKPGGDTAPGGRPRVKGFLLPP